MVLKTILKYDFENRIKISSSKIC